MAHIAQATLYSMFGFARRHTIQMAIYLRGIDLMFSNLLFIDLKIQRIALFVLA